MQLDAAWPRLANTVGGGSVAAGAWAAGSCGESVGVGGAGARQVGRQRRGAYGQAGHAEVAAAAEVCDGGPDARRCRKAWVLTNLTKEFLPGSCALGHSKGNYQLLVGIQ